MYYYIYKVTNKVSGKFYIGRHISKRKVDHRYRGSGIHLKRAIKKYGWENFSIEILEYCNNLEDLKQRESELVTETEVSNPDCYNLAVGGTGSAGRQPGFETPQEVRDKISLANMGNVPWNKGKTYSEAHKNKLKAIHEAKGYTHSDEVKERISSRLKGIPKTEEHKRNISKSRTGKVHSEETRAKLKEAAKHKDYSKLKLPRPTRRKRVQTPLGIFNSVGEAAAAHNKCMGWISTNFTKKPTEFKRLG